MTTTAIQKPLNKARQVPFEMIPYLRENLIFEDDDPIKSTVHRDFMTNLIQLVRDSRGLPVDYFVAGNAAVYFSPKMVPIYRYHRRIMAGYGLNNWTFILVIGKVLSITNGIIGCDFMI